MMMISNKRPTSWPKRISRARVLNEVPASPASFTHEAGRGVGQQQKSLQGSFLTIRRVSFGVFAIQTLSTSYVYIILTISTARTAYTDLCNGFQRFLTISGCTSGRDKLDIFVTLEPPQASLVGYHAIIRVHVACELITYAAHCLL